MHTILALAAWSLSLHASMGRPVLVGLEDSSCALQAQQACVAPGDTLLDVQKEQSSDIIDAENYALAQRAVSPHVKRLGGAWTGAALSVRFYVYDEIDWPAMKCNGEPVHTLFADPTIQGREGLATKHSDDYLFMKAALSHPMRTTDPAEAELFVVPALINTVLITIAFSHSYTCCVGDVCGTSLLNRTDEMLAKSPWFRRSQGKDHVVVNSHWAWRTNTKQFPRVQQCNSISFEENSMRDGRCRIASTYVGSRCRHVKKDASFAMVGSMHPELQNFQLRRDICEWLSQAFSKNPQLSFSNCGPGDMCPAVPRAKFGFHARGDTFGSNRPMDLILSGTVPIFTAPQQYDILPPFLPLRNVTFALYTEGQGEFEAGLAEVLRQYSSLKAALDTYASWFDWETQVPFEKYMAAFRDCVR